jgi:hypothetical protein
MTRMRPGVRLPLRPPRKGRSGGASGLFDELAYADACRPVREATPENFLGSLFAPRRHCRRRAAGPSGDRPGKAAPLQERHRELTARQEAGGQREKSSPRQQESQQTSCPGCLLRRPRRPAPSKLASSKATTRRGEEGAPDLYGDAAYGSGELLTYGTRRVPALPYRYGQDSGTRPARRQPLVHDRRASRKDGHIAFSAHTQGPGALDSDRGYVKRRRSHSRRLREGAP